MKRIVAAGMAMVMAASAGAETKTGAAFLKINPSVRGEALGGLNPVAAFGAAGMTVNPASLALMERNELATGFAAMMGDSAYGTVGVGLKRGTGGIGASATMLRSGTLEGRDASGSATAGFIAQDVSAGLTGAVSAGENLQVGATVKGVRESLGSFHSNTATAVDAGAILETGNVAWGLSALNVGGKLRYEGGTDTPLPAVYSLGVSVPMGGGLAGLGGISRSGSDTTANMGVEYRLGPVSLRLGYRSDGGSSLAKSGQSGTAQAMQGLTGGLGVVVRNLRIDYAASQTAVEWGMSQRASVTWKWGGADAERRPMWQVTRPAPRPAARPAAKGVNKPAPKVGSTMTTGSRRAYDHAPIAAKKKKRWVD